VRGRVSSAGHAVPVMPSRMIAAAIRFTGCPRRGAMPSPASMLGCFQATDTPDPAGPPPRVSGTAFASNSTHRRVRDVRPRHRPYLKICM
jgi:hypothetical protein